MGYQERDPIRGEDSWRSFDEVLTIAEEWDVDMVLLAGDLFHDNKPSRKALYHVMSSLRKHCLGMKPCELELLSDNSEVFEGFVQASTCLYRIVSDRVSGDSTMSTMKTQT